MFIKKVKLKTFRNYQEVDISFQKNINIIIGRNAQGKTSLIEAMYVLSTTKSHRTGKDQQMIGFKEEFARIEATVSRGTDEYDLSLSLSKKGKKANYNGIVQKKLSEYVGKLIVVLFAPEDLSLVKGAPQYRRRFLDMEIGQLSPSYLYHLAQYSKLLRQRNELLKQLRSQRKSDLFLEVLTEQMVPHAKFLVDKRIEFLGKLQEYAQKIQMEITEGAEKITIDYHCSFEGRNMTEQELFDFYKTHFSSDIQNGTTGSGPHRDDFSVFINDVNTHRFGSQGQQRTASLSIKLAEIDLIFSVLGEYPILLLDDVLSELDDMRQTQLLNSIKNKVQTFITTTNIDGIDKDVVRLADIFIIENAEIRIGDQVGTRSI